MKFEQCLKYFAIIVALTAVCYSQKILRKDKKSKLKSQKTRKSGGDPVKLYASVEESTFYDADILKYLGTGYNLLYGDLTGTDKHHDQGYRYNMVKVPKFKVEEDKEFSQPQDLDEAKKAANAKNGYIRRVNGFTKNQMAERIKSISDATSSTTFNGNLAAGYSGISGAMSFSYKRIKHILEEKHKELFAQTSEFLAYEAGYQSFDYLDVSNLEGAWMYNENWIKISQQLEEDNVTNYNLCKAKGKNIEQTPECMELYQPWRNFFNKYGTHIVNGLQIGGRLIDAMEVDKNVIKNEDKKSVTGGGSVSFNNPLDVNAIFEQLKVKSACNKNCTNMSTDAQESKQLAKIGGSYGYTKSIREEINKYKLSLSTYQLGGLPVTDSKINVGDWGKTINANPGVISKTLKTMEKVFKLKVKKATEEKIHDHYHFWLSKYFELESQGIDYTVNKCETTAQDIAQRYSHLNLYSGIKVRCTLECNEKPKVGINENHAIIFEKDTSICKIAKWWGYKLWKPFTIKYFINYDEPDEYKFNDIRTDKLYNLDTVNKNKYEKGKEDLNIKVGEEYVSALFWERRIDYSQCIYSDWYKLGRKNMSAIKKKTKVFLKYSALTLAITVNPFFLPMIFFLKSDPTYTEYNYKCPPDATIVALESYTEKGKPYPIFNEAFDYRNSNQQYRIQCCLTQLFDYHEFESLNPKYNQKTSEDERKDNPNTFKSNDPFQQKDCAKDIKDTDNFTQVFNKLETIENKGFKYGYKAAFTKNEKNNYNYVSSGLNFMFPDMSKGPNTIWFLSGKRSKKSLSTTERDPIFESEVFEDKPWDLDDDQHKILKCPEHTSIDRIALEYTNCEDDKAVCQYLKDVNVDFVPYNYKKIDRSSDDVEYRHYSQKEDKVCRKTKILCR